MGKRYNKKASSKGISAGIKKERENKVISRLSEEYRLWEIKERERDWKAGEKLRGAIAKVRDDGGAWNKEIEAQVKAEIDAEMSSDWKDYFPSFIRRVAPNIQFTRYHLFLMLLYQAAYEKACKDGKQVVMAISCPPQTGKTLITTMFGSFLALKYPDESTLVFSYGYTHAVRIGRDMFNWVSRACGEYGLEIAKDKRAMNNFGFAGKRGGVEAMGIDGTSTGVGGVFRFVDDPLKDDEEADNPTLRNKKWEYIEDKIITRHRYLPNGGNITIYIMTRRHLDDPIGHLDKMWIPAELSENGIARKYCEYIRIPFLCDDEGTDPLMRKVGEPLDPNAPRERGLGINTAKYLMATLSARRWSAQYQQKPVIEEGNIIKRDWFKWYDEKTKPMMFQKITLSCDLSNEGARTSDNSAFSVWGKDGDNHYLLDFSEGKWGFTSQMAIIRKYCELYHVDKVLIEKRATGTAMIDYLSRDLSGVNIVGFEPKFSTKIERLDSCEPYFAGGHIFLPSEKIKPKVEVLYLAQLLAFPSGSQDGLVDTTSQYLMDDRQSKGGKMVIDKDGFYDKLGTLWRN